jgi:hypothetical protein
MDIFMNKEYLHEEQMSYPEGVNRRVKTQNGLPMQPVL